MGLHDLHGVQWQGGWVPSILTYVRVQGEISFALSKKASNAYFTEFLMTEMTLQRFCTVGHAC